MGIDGLILGKLICPGVIPPMDVAEKDQFTVIIKENPLRLLEHGCQSGGLIFQHELLPSSQPKQ
jgi:hypothetical protein